MMNNMMGNLNQMMGFQGNWNGTWGMMNWVG
jgi:hypothetical protein